MKTFNCQNCGQTVFFENDRCLRCENTLGFISQALDMSSFHVENNRFISYLDKREYRLCKNSQLHQACNWMIEADSPEDYCMACLFNRTVPNLSNPENLEHWRIIEAGKRRLLYSLIRLGLPLITKKTDPENGLAFEFLKDTFERIQANDRVMTGHADGVITLNIAEADDVERERRKQTLKEDYRTVLGHFRHESGHYYWQQLVHQKSPLDEFRHLFGDERLDYSQAVADYYKNGAADNWQDKFISAYATCHPWEDFAETWGNYILIVDTLETADEFSLKIHDITAYRQISFDAYHASSFDELLQVWLPLTLAVNNINRSGGKPDLYPFVLSAQVIQKLDYVHRLIHQTSTAT